MRGAEMVSPCVPDIGTGKTRKIKYFIKGTTTGTDDGFCNFALAPRRFASNYASNNSGPPLLLTAGLGTGNATGAFPTLDTGGALPATWIAANWNSDYSTAVLNPLVTVRVVAAGLRVRYSGKVINEGGVWELVITPDHATLGGLTSAQIARYETYSKIQVDRTWTRVLYAPLYNNERTLDSDETNGHVPLLDDHYMGIIGHIEPGETVEYEAVLLGEMMGAVIRDLTPSTADIVALEATVNHQGPGSVGEEAKNPMNTIRDIVQYIPEELSRVGDTVGKIAGSAKTGMEFVSKIASLM
jgi:hypothetical protein